MRPFHIVLSAAAFLTLTAAPSFAADCALPGTAPAVPDGATATLEQMKAGHQAVQSYANALQSVQDCYEAKIKLGQKNTKPEELQKWRDAGNAAVDQAKAFGDAYTAQVKIYKARQPVK